MARTQVGFWSLPPPHQPLALGHLFCLISTAKNSVLRELYRYLCVVCRAENDLETALHTARRMRKGVCPGRAGPEAGASHHISYHLISPPSASLGEKKTGFSFFLSLSPPTPCSVSPVFALLLQKAHVPAGESGLRATGRPSRQSEPEALFRVPEQPMEKWCGPSPLVTDPARHPFARVSQWERPSAQPSSVLTP